MAGYNADTNSWAVPPTDTVYVDGLPQGITEKDVEEYFGSIGVIKLDKKTRSKKIWLYRDKATGQLKGDGTVSYEDPFSAGSAVDWFNNKEWKGVKQSHKYTQITAAAAAGWGESEHEGTSAAPPCRGGGRGGGLGR